MGTGLLYMLLGFGESCLLAYVGTRLVGFRLAGWKLGLLAALYFAAVVAVRAVYATYGIPLGTHTLVAGAALISLLKLVTPMPWPTAASGGLLGLVLVMLGDQLITIGFVLSKVDPSPIFRVPYYYLLLSLVEKTPLLAVAALIWRYNFSLLHLGRNVQED